jgi:NhaP-type Na+/H+ or K+/H+ antiporter
MFIGIILAMLSSLTFKAFRFLTVNPVIECNLVFCFGYLSYGAAEFLNCSGIISLLTCGILMAHYTWYNLSTQSKSVTSVAF